MFVDFNQVFNDKTNSQWRIPEATIEYLSRKLPEGLRYTRTEDGQIAVTSEGENLVFGGWKLSPNEEQKKVLGDHFTDEDLIQYSYNAQQLIPLKLDKEGFIQLNGNEVPIDKLCFQPLNPIKYMEGSCFLIPMNFPAPFQIAIGCEGYEQNLMISRVPNESIDIMEFESSKDHCLIVNFKVNQTTQKMTIRLSYNFSKDKSIRDIVESIKIYNAYMNGQGYFCHQKLESAVVGKEARHVDVILEQFWERVLSLEEVLDVEFIPLQNSLDKETVQLVDILYQNLVKHNPIKSKDKVDSIDGTWDALKKEEIEKNKNIPMYFEFEATAEFSLFETQITLPGIIGIFNAVVTELTEDENSQHLLLCDASEDKPRYTVKLWCKTIEEVKQYRTEKHDNLMDAFHKAQTLEEIYGHNRN